MTHLDKHPQAGQTVQVSFATAPNPQLQDPSGTYDFKVDDWWDHLTGGSWMFSDGNSAALMYAMRTGMALGAIPLDDEVVYGYIGSFGHLVHASEIVLATVEV